MAITEFYLNIIVIKVYDQKLIGFLSNPKLCNKITNSAYKFFIKNYSDKLNYKILLNIYKTAIRKKQFLNQMKKDSHRWICFSKIII